MDLIHNSRSVKYRQVFYS